MHGEILASGRRNCIKTNINANKFTKVRVTVNNGSSFAQRDSKLESFLEGKEAQTKLATEALDHLDTEIYDKRSDEYKQHMFRVSLKNAIHEIVEKSK